MNKQIANWDSLSDEDKDKAQKLLKGQPGLNPAVVHPAAKFFEENGWVKIEKYINLDMANLLYHHVQLEAKRLSWFEDSALEVDDAIHGTFADHQAPGDFSKYGDPIFDALLSLGTEKMNELTGKELVPTYSYHRLYTQGTELTRHKDRPSCEISLLGNNHAQVFLHYNEKEGQYDIPYDGRPLLGLPSTFRSKESMKKADEAEALLRSKHTEITENEKIIY